MSIYQCPNCGMTRSGNQAMGLAMPQCQCAWQFSPPVTPQRTWVGLTDEERHACTQSPFTTENYRAIEAKLKEKNT